MIRDNSIWYAAMREAGYSQEFCVKEERGFDVTDETANITMGELLDEMIVRIECTNGLDFISREDIQGLIDQLTGYLDKVKLIPWKHDAPLNPEFLGAQPPRVGEDY